MRLRGIKSQRNVARLLIEPVESSVQNAEPEISIDDKVLGRWLVSRKPGKIRRLFPDEPRLIDFLSADQITHVIENVTPLDGLMKRCKLRPYFCYALGFFSRNQKIQKAGINGRERRNHITQQTINIRLHAPAKLQSGGRQIGIVLQHGAEFS